jgi:hypothetical protein
MRTFIFTLLLVVLGLDLQAQVGVNTNNPDELLHLAGANKNIRIDGLNHPNNFNNLGPESTSRVFFNSLGNMVLGSMLDSAPLLIDSGNYLTDEETPSNIVIQVGHGLGYTPTADPTDWPGAIFTLTQSAILEVNYSVSWSIYDAQSLEKKRIYDSRARVIHTGVYFIEVNDTSDPYKPSNTPVVNDADGVPINGGPWCINPTGNNNNCQDWAGLIALNGQYYGNSDSEIGEYKNFQTNGSDYVKLPAGTYAALFACKLEVESTQGTGAAKLWLGSGDDELQIRVYYYD